MNTCFIVNYVDVIVADNAENAEGYMPQCMLPILRFYRRSSTASCASTGIAREKMSVCLSVRPSHYGLYIAIGRLQCNVM